MTKGERLQEVRKRAGFSTAEEAARRFGWHPGTYRAHESGRGLHSTAAEKYATAFGVSPAAIMFGDQEVGQPSAPAPPRAVDPLLIAAWQRLSAKGRKKLLQIAVILAED